MIAPQLSAPGIDVKKVKEETGWNVVFGPVYAEDIPEYVKNNFQKTERMHLVGFNLKDRVEMATIYFVAINLILSIPLLILFPNLYPSMILLTALMTYFMYITFPYFPVRSGFAKVALSEILFLSITVIFFSSHRGKPVRFTASDDNIPSDCSGDRRRFQRHLAHL